MSRHHIKYAILISGIFLAVLNGFVPHAHVAQAPKSAAELEKEKALKNPYPNDFGPESVDVSKYSANAKAGYALLKQKCTVCHTASRPLNSQFVQLNEAEIATEKKSRPEVFNNKLIWQVESQIWQRYVKRMMSKPGCNIANQDGKKIFEFLVEDSKARKTGAQAAKWQAHRQKLVSDFKEKHPDHFKQLFSPN